MGRGGVEAPPSLGLRGGETATLRAADAVPTTSRPADRLFALCARRTLDHSTQAALVTLGASLDWSAWREFGARARAEGIEGLALAHLSAGELLGKMPTDVVDALLGAYRAAWLGNRRLRSVLAEILAALNERGVEAIVMKGVALAQRYYGEVGLRPTGDLDLLVDRADLAACQAALLALGCHPQRDMGQPRDFYSLLFHALVFEHPSGLTVELHWELTSLPMYLPRLRADAALRSRAEHIEIAGQPARYLAPADELRYLALHAIVQHAEMRRAIWLIDIAELVRRLPPTWDWDTFAEETRRLGLATPVLAALLAAGQHGSISVPPQALAKLSRATASRDEQRAWRRSFGRDVGVRLPGAVLRHLRVQETLGDRLSLFWRLVGRARRRWLRQITSSAHRLAPARHNARPRRTEAVNAREATEAETPLSGPARSARLSPQADGEQVASLPALLLSTNALPSATTLVAEHDGLEPQAEDAGADLVPQSAAARAPRPRRAYHAAKRSLDIVVAALLLLLLSPLLVLVALLVKLDGGPAIYLRAAIGQGERPFFMIKFRTMRPDADALLKADQQFYAQYQRNFKLAHDPRVTSLGHWLRRFSIDELPQLWNVLRGEMSLVGPRAVHADEVPAFGGFFAERQSAPPGLTGLWQVSGRANTTYERRIELDREYVRTCSFWGDVGILLRTAPAVVRGSGAY